MCTSATNPDAVLKYEVEESDQGRVELIVPFALGARLVVYVRREGNESCADLMAGAESSLRFWDNPLDDEDWNGQVRFASTRSIRWKSR